MLKKLLILGFLAAATFATPTVVNLEVEEQRVIANLRGLASDRDILQRQAIAQARGEADLLVDTHFFFEEDGDSITVTVTGRQARQVIGEQAQVLQQAQAQATAPEEATQETNESRRKERVNHGNSIYVSLRAQTALPWSSAGAIIQVGYFQNRTFWGLDFGMGQGANARWGDEVINASDYFFKNASLSFGGRIKPNDNFQTVLGAFVGGFTKFNDAFVRTGVGSWSSTGHYVRSSEWILAQGPFAKFIFGQGPIRFEFSNRVAIGQSFGAFIMEAGITFSPSPRER